MVTIAKPQRLSCTENCLALGAGGEPLLATGIGERLRPRPRSSTTGLVLGGDLGREAPAAFPARPPIIARAWPTRLPKAPGPLMTLGPLAPCCCDDPKLRFELLFGLMLFADPRELLRFCMPLMLLRIDVPPGSGSGPRLSLELSDTVEVGADS